MIDALLAQLWPLALVMAGIGYWVHVSNRRRYKTQVQFKSAASAYVPSLGCAVQFPNAP
jgi:hypothetical protein